MLYKIRNLAFVLIVIGVVLVVPLAADVEAQGQGPDSQQIYGLSGTVQAAVNHTFGHYFAADDGVTYGLLGATPAVEAQLGVQARDFPTTKIKVWGTHMPDSEGYPTILVTDLLVPEVEPPAATPTATSTPQPAMTPIPQPVTVVVKRDPAVLRTGPHLNFPWFVTVPLGTECTAVGRNSAASWVQVSCPGGELGWLWIEMVYINGDINTLPVINTPPPPAPTATPRPPTATPRPTATPQPPTATPKPPPNPQTGQWRARYYNNLYFAGNAAVDRIEPRGPNYPMQKTFHGSPAPGVISAYWSARFDGPFWFGGGDYIFHAAVGDPVRVYLDDHLVLNDWSSGDHLLSNKFQNVGAGEHRVRIDHLDFSGQGWLNVWWELDDGRNRD